MTQPQPNEIWLVQFPFSDLTSTKLRPALIISIHREEIILIGIFSKIPTTTLQNTWVLISEQDSNFEQTGLKKTSLIRADKIATVNKTVFVKKLGTLPIDLIPLVQLALKKALNLFED
jgi:mRNA interferase MazF